MWQAVRGWLSMGEAKVTRLVRYICAAPQHQQLSLFERGSEWAPNTLTYRDSAWAYCPLGAPGGHEWQQIPDRDYEQLREETEERIASGR
jgi:hypothetical protein